MTVVVVLIVKMSYTSVSVYAPQNILGFVIPILQTNNSLEFKDERAVRCLFHTTVKKN